jgi:hypothetical protein
MKPAERKCETCGSKATRLIAKDTTSPGTPVCSACVPALLTGIQGPVVVRDIDPVRHRRGRTLISPIYEQD